MTVNPTSTPLPPLALMWSATETPSLPGRGPEAAGKCVLAASGETR